MAGIHMIGCPPGPPEDLPLDGFQDLVACVRRVRAKDELRALAHRTTAARGTEDAVEKLDQALRAEAGIEEPMGNVADFLRWAGKA